MSTQSRDPPSRGSKLFSACLVSDHGEIRQQCAALSLNPEQIGTRRNLLLGMQTAPAAENVIDWQSSPGDTPLMACCWRGDAAAVKLLLNAGADVSLCNQRGVSPLLMACHQGHHECAMLCLAAGADVDSADDRDFTPVYAAACRGHSEIVHDCIVIGADVKGATGARALIACCYKGHVNCAALLVHAGADVDAHHQDRTAVEWALHCGHLEAARVVEVCSKMRGAVPPSALAAMGSPAFKGARVNLSANDRRLKRGATIQFQSSLLGASWLGEKPVCDGPSPISTVVAGKESDKELAAAKPIAPVVPTSPLLAHIEREGAADPAAKEPPKGSATGECQLRSPIHWAGASVLSFPSLCAPMHRPSCRCDEGSRPARR